VSVKEPGRTRPEEVRPQCRLCGAELSHTFVDLGMSPLANRYLSAAQLNEMEPFYPLRAWVCARCLLVQLEEFASPASIFTDYAYFASYSDTWVEHARSYVDMIVERFGLSKSSQVVEIASNDGYLLQHMVAKGIPVLGIEPAANVAEEAIRRGIPTLVEFFGEAMARRLVAGGTRADLLIGNNVLAHVPGLNDFVRGMAVLAAARSIITMEFPHLLRLIEGSEFDTIYHEHFSYFSLISVEQAFARHGLTIFDVDELPTHGGSLRIYATHTEAPVEPVSDRVAQLRRREEAAGLGGLDVYLQFNERVKESKRQLLEFLIGVKRDGRSVVGYGAPAKGNTLLNYCGIRSDFIDYTVDRSPHKQGRFLPGTHLPIRHPDRIRETRPDYVLILPWNLKSEIMEQMAFIREWGGRFVVPVPEVAISP
jgi:C-methyltransferase-like protein/putative zinc binding protein/methyltransferase family protein